MLIFQGVMVMNPMGRIRNKHHLKKKHIKDQPYFVGKTTNAPFLKGGVSEMLLIPWYHMILLILFCIQKKIPKLVVNGDETCGFLW